MNNVLIEKILENKRNVIIEGNSLSGKTTNILFPILEDIIRNKESFFVLDCKGEYSNYSSMLSENGYDVIEINLRRTNSFHRWNPLQYPYNLYKKTYRDKAQEEIENIAKILFSEAKSVDSFWNDSSIELFTGIALCLFEDAKPKEVNINSINEMLCYLRDNSPESDVLKNYIKSKNVFSKQYLLLTPTVFSPISTRVGIICHARHYLSSIVSKNSICQLISDTTFDFDIFKEDITNINSKENKEKPKAYIFISKDEDKSLSWLPMVFIKQLYDILLSKEVPKNKFNFILDNFDILKKLDNFSNILEASPYRNIKFYIATHSIERLKKVHEDDFTCSCDLVSINENNIMYKMNNTNFEYEKIVNNNNIVLKPMVNQRTAPEIENIKIFNLKKHVEKLKKENIISADAANPFRQNVEIKHDIKSEIERIKNKIFIEISTSWGMSNPGTKTTVLTNDNEIYEYTLYLFNKNNEVYENTLHHFNSEDLDYIKRFRKPDIFRKIGLIDDEKMIYIKKYLKENVIDKPQSNDSIRDASFTIVINMNDKKYEIRNNTILFGTLSNLIK